MKDARRQKSNHTDAGLCREFATEALERLDHAISILQQDPQTALSCDNVDSMLRAFHTIKGGAAFLGLSELTLACHRLETYLETIGREAATVSDESQGCLQQALDELGCYFDAMAHGDETPRWRLDGLLGDRFATPEAPNNEEINEAEFEQLLDHIDARQSDNPLTPTALALSDGLRRPPVDPVPALRIEAALVARIAEQVEALAHVQMRLYERGSELAGLGLEADLEHLSAITRELSTLTVGLDQQPVGATFARFQRLARTFAVQLGKNVHLSATGGDVGFDASVLPALSDVLIHLIRNAIDHGIEPECTRRALGKPVPARVTLEASANRGLVKIAVSDDGCGIDADELRETAIKLRMLSAEQAGRLDREACLNLIFEPGFSTNTEMTLVSGRGVGLDVVRRFATRLNGHARIQSIPSRGTTISIEFPSEAFAGSDERRDTGKVFKAA